ncbi:hypothetical protein D3C72_1311590 [compost metagenome]
MPIVPKPRSAYRVCGRCSGLAAPDAFPPVASAAGAAPPTCTSPIAVSVSRDASPPAQPRRSSVSSAVLSKAVRLMAPPLPAFTLPALPPAVTPDSQPPPDTSSAAPAATSTLPYTVPRPSFIGVPSAIEPPWMARPSVTPWPVSLTHWPATLSRLFAPRRSTLSALPPALSAMEPPGAMSLPWMSKLPGMPWPS